MKCYYLNVHFQGQRVNYNCEAPYYTSCFKPFFTFSQMDLNVLHTTLFSGTIYLFILPLAWETIFKIYAKRLMKLHFNPCSFGKILTNNYNNKQIRQNQISAVTNIVPRRCALLTRSGADKSLARPDWKNNWKVAIFRPTRRSLLPRRHGWTDNFLNFFWVPCKSCSLAA